MFFCGAPGWLGTPSAMILNVAKMKIRHIDRGIQLVIIASDYFIWNVATGIRVFLCMWLVLVSSKFQGLFRR